MMHHGYYFLSEIFYRKMRYLDAEMALTACEHCQLLIGNKMIHLSQCRCIPREIAAMYRNNRIVVVYAELHRPLFKEELDGFEYRACFFDS